MTVRWVNFNPDTTELERDAVAAALSDRTRLAAVTGASNLLGTRPDLPAIAAAVHAAGPGRSALFYVDGVHLTPHAPVDMQALGADFFACSPYKFCGPHIGVLAVAPTLLETLQPDKLLPSTNAIPERFELGTLPYELLADITATVDFLAGLGIPQGSRRKRLRSAMQALEQHERRLFARLEVGLRHIHGVALHGKAKLRTPTALISLRDHHPADFSKRLAEAGIYAPSGHFYALEAAHQMGLSPAGAVRATPPPYTNDDEIDHLLRGIACIRDGLPHR